MAGAAMGMAFRQLRGLFELGSVVALEDGQLLARYEADRDEAAFEALVGRHGPMVLTTCRAVLRDEHDVEDAFQATFLVLAKKAGSVRKDDSLGGWLHRVARRASVQTSVEARRRRLKEAEAAQARRDVSRPDPELAAWLHEEIDRLPEAQRLPVVLCDLEGLTYEQAARQLGWTTPTLRNRLARARQRLKTRLTRRGQISPTLVTLPSAVPPKLARMTLSAATGGTPSAGASLLTSLLSRGMLMSRIKLVSAASMAALALASAGMMALSGGRPAQDPYPAPKPKAEVSMPVPSGEKPGDMVEVRGLVVAPDGKPVAGATVAGLTVGGVPPDPMVKTGTEMSGPDGRFAIRLRAPAGAPTSQLTSFPWLLATAPGYGLNWTERALRPDRPAEQVVTLAEEGPPIEGRIINLEGRPLAGVQVEVARIFFGPGGDLASWIAKTRDGSPAGLQGLVALNVGVDRLVTMTARTDPDGRFKLTGVGRDRIAELNVSGAGIATSRVKVFSRDEPEFRSTGRNFNEPTPLLVHAPRFELAVAPSRRVEGVVRDKETGQPIAGLTIKAGVFNDYFRSPAEGVETTTDAEGRYRLDGLPIATTYRLVYERRPGLPYTDGSFKVTAGSPPPGPVAFDFALKRGIVVRGRVTDKVTGAPIQGNVFYFAQAVNPNLGQFPGFSEAIDMQYGRIQDDGRYEIIALPGPGLLAVKNFENRYRSATGLEAIRGYDSRLKGFYTALAPIPAGGYNLFVETDYDVKTPSATVDLPLDPGWSATIRVVDPQGRPLEGTRVFGMGHRVGPGGVDQNSAIFEVHALDPSQPQRMTITHAGRKLAGSVVLRGDEIGRINVLLVPWGTIVGRFVDDEGRPRKNIGLMSLEKRGSNPSKANDRGVLPEGMTRVDGDGRFRIEGLVPGLKYDGDALEQGRLVGVAFEGLTVASGEVKDLGDIQVKPPRP